MATQALEIEFPNPEIFLFKTVDRIRRQICKKTIVELSERALIQILNYLDESSIRALSLSCKRLNNLIEQNYGASACLYQYWKRGKMFSCRNPRRSVAYENFNFNVRSFHKLQLVGFTVPRFDCIVYNPHFLVELHLINSIHSTYILAALSNECPNLESFYMAERPRVKCGDISFRKPPLENSNWRNQRKAFVAPKLSKLFISLHRPETMIESANTIMRLLIAPKLTLLSYELDEIFGFDWSQSIQHLGSFICVHSQLLTHLSIRISLKPDSYLGPFYHERATNEMLRDLKEKIEKLYYHKLEFLYLNDSKYHLNPWTSSLITKPEGLKELNDDSTLPEFSSYYQCFSNSFSTLTRVSLKNIPVTVRDFDCAPLSSCHVLKALLLEVLENARRCINIFNLKKLPPSLEILLFGGGAHSESDFRYLLSLNNLRHLALVKRPIEPLQRVQGSVFINPDLHSLLIAGYKFNTSLPYQMMANLLYGSEPNVIEFPSSNIKLWTYCQKNYLLELPNSDIP